MNGECDGHPRTRPAHLAGPGEHCVLVLPSAPPAPLAPPAVPAIDALPPDPHLRVATPQWQALPRAPDLPSLCVWRI